MIQGRLVFALPTSQSIKDPDWPYFKAQGTDERLGFRTGGTWDNGRGTGHTDVFTGHLSRALWLPEVPVRAREHIPWVLSSAW